MHGERMLIENSGANKHRAVRTLTLHVLPVVYAACCRWSVSPRKASWSCTRRAI